MAKAAKPSTIMTVAIIAPALPLFGCLGVTGTFGRDVAWLDLAGADVFWTPGCCPESLAPGGGGDATSITG